MTKAELERQRRYRARNGDKVRARARNYYKLIRTRPEYLKRRKELQKSYPRKKESEPRACLICGALFFGLRFKKNPQRFCSRRCLAVNYEQKSQTRVSSLNYKIRQCVRVRIRTALKCSKGKKATKTTALLGCSVEFARKFLEARFLPGMSWENYGKGAGKWEIDHHIPCAEFDLRDPAQQRQCFHYSNLRPLWGKDNMRKGKKRPATHQAELL